MTQLNCRASPRSIEKTTDHATLHTLDASIGVVRQIFDVYRLAVESASRRPRTADGLAGEELVATALFLADGLMAAIQRCRGPSTELILERLHPSLELWVVATRDLLDLLEYRQPPIDFTTDILDGFEISRLRNTFAAVRRRANAISEAFPRIPRTIAFRPDPFRELDAAPADQS